ncbi:MAG: NAD/NADP octopine/nopaline dehydrogenase family protein, partial [Clostridiales bacterium]|nr:NAD/NADP octopine/nopaline dehydrogenase family protein [Clostridiales bacterium]
VLNPGRTGGALEINNIIKKWNSFKKVCIVEAQTLLFTCRAMEQGRVKIFSKKQEVKVAAFPAIKNDDFINIIGDAFPEFIPVASVLETSFNNIGAVLHPIITILNCGRIESINEEFQFYIDGVTPAVAKIIEKVDYERILVAKALNIDYFSLRDWLKFTYDSHGDTLCQILNNTKAYSGIKAPNNLDTRYIFEDVPQSLVPISDMAKNLGIQTPTIDAMIHLASVLHNTNYWKSGRKLVDMGIEDLSPREIKEFVIGDDVMNLKGAMA